MLNSEMHNNLDKMNTNMLCLPSKVKMEKIKRISEELIQEKAHLVETNCITKFYKQYDKTLQMSEMNIKDVQAKVKAIIKTKEIQKAARLKDKNGKVSSLFGLNDSEISSFYGNPVLELKEKQFLKEEINYQIVSAFKKDYFNSDVSRKSFGKDGKIPSYFDNKIQVVKLLNTLQLKVNKCQKLLTSVEECLQQLRVIRRDNESAKSTHITHIMQEAQDLSLKAKILELKSEEAVVGENENIVEAMDVLKDELEKCVLEDTVKLKQLNTTSQEYKQVEGKEFRNLLNTYVKILKSVKHYKFLLDTIHP